MKKIGKNPKAKNSLCKNPDYKDALAIVEGRFGEPVKRAGRFINCNYPPNDVSMEELERIWGAPDDVVSLRNIHIKPLKKSEKKH